MSDFNSISTFVKCDNFKVGGYLWPIDYNVNDAYLKFSNENSVSLKAKNNKINKGTKFRRRLAKFFLTEIIALPLKQ